ncbi:hypothetical protein THRCLA_10132 [Thraustotheca clavata]|uniref:Uncharacterized protein n=1 Tax=Thraustotheca clavata TaxID=74557 RepID=A0A1V9YSL4_9STRA|nr:hypothetical protein THRCLA_10132 [Thraustotheca clavata]
MDSPPRSVSPPHISRRLSSRSSISSSSQDLPRYMQETTSSIQKYGLSEESSPPRSVCHPPGNPMIKRASKSEIRPVEDIEFTRRGTNFETSRHSPPKFPTYAELQRNLEEMTMHCQRSQALLNEKDAIIATFTQTCARLKADCETLAEKALEWKTNYKTLKKISLWMMSANTPRPLVRPSSAHPRRALERKLSKSGIPVASNESTEAIAKLVFGITSTEQKITRPRSSSIPVKTQRSQSLILPTNPPPAPIQAPSTIDIQPSIISRRPKSASSYSENAALRSKQLASRASTSKLLGSQKTLIEADTTADLRNLLNTSLSREKSAVEALETKNEANRYLNNQLEEKQKLLANTQKVCEKFQGDCEALADKALYWKKKYQTLLDEHEGLKVQSQSYSQVPASNTNWELTDSNDEDFTIIENFETNDAEEIEPLLPNSMPGRLNDDDNHGNTISSLEEQLQERRKSLAMETELHRFKQHIVNLSNVHDEQVAELETQISNDNNLVKLRHVRKQLTIARNVIAELKAELQTKDKFMKQQQTKFTKITKLAEESQAKSQIIAKLQQQYDILQNTIKKQKEYHERELHELQSKLSFLQENAKQ